jgi:hypothetical protein
LLAPAARAAEPVSAELLSKPFNENYQPEVEVSGNVIVGIMTAAAAGALAQDLLGVRVLEAAQTTDLCLRATTSDGIYSSRNHYRLPAERTGAVHLPYASSKREILGGYAEAEVAIAANVGDCDSSSSSYYVVGSLDTTQPAATVIYLNSFGATDVFLSLDGSEQPPQACEHISEGRRTTYDFYCTLMPADNSSVTVSIIRERFGREQPGVQFSIIGLSP